VTGERLERRRKSTLTLAEWRQCAAQVWTFPGAKKETTSAGVKHMAPFPTELPARLIRFYSCIGDLVLDPFCGTGTTVKVARELGRSAVGYELEEDFRELIQRKTHILEPSIGRASKLDEFVTETA
jgi:modification methylase